MNIDWEEEALLHLINSVGENLFAITHHVTIYDEISWWILSQMLYENWYLVFSLDDAGGRTALFHMYICM